MKITKKGLLLFAVMMLSGSAFSQGFSNDPLGDAQSEFSTQYTTLQQIGEIFVWALLIIGLGTTIWAAVSGDNRLKYAIFTLVAGLALATIGYGTGII